MVAEKEFHILSTTHTLKNAKEQMPARKVKILLMKMVIYLCYLLEKFVVKVEHLSGERYKMEVTKKTGVFALMLKIQERCGIELENQLLYFDGKQLKAKDLLENYDLVNGSKINLLHRVQGGQRSIF